MTNNPEFDPAEHNVAEVVEHLDANPNDRERILEAETAGKARRGVLDHGAPSGDITTDNLGRVVQGGRDFLGRAVSDQT